MLLCVVKMNFHSCLPNVWCHLILTFSGIIITSSSGVDPDALSSAFGRHLDDDVRVCVR